MEEKSQRPKDREGVISLLNATVEALDLANGISSTRPAKAAFGSVNVLLTMIRARSLLFCNDPFQIYAYPAFDDQRTRSP